MKHFEQRGTVYILSLKKKKSLDPSDQYSVSAIIECCDLYKLCQLKHLYEFSYFSQVDPAVVFFYNLFLFLLVIWRDPGAVQENHIPGFQCIADAVTMIRALLKKYLGTLCQEHGRLVYAVAGLPGSSSM